jgi:hypothetical protein
MKVVEFIMITFSRSPLSKRPRVDKGNSPFYKAIHPFILAVLLASEQLKDKRKL